MKVSFVRTVNGQCQKCGKQGVVGEFRSEPDELGNYRKFLCCQECYKKQVASADSANEEKKEETLISSIKEETMPKTTKNSNANETKRNLYIAASIVLLIIILVALVVCADSGLFGENLQTIGEKCKVDGCKQEPVTGYDYCSEHKCREEFCGRLVADGSRYCENHKTCSAVTCTNDRRSDSKYCDEHDCDIAGCHNICVDGNDYCQEHLAKKKQAQESSDNTMERDEEIESEENVYDSGNTYYAVSCSKNGVQWLCSGCITVSNNGVSFSNDSTIFPGRYFEKRYQGTKDGDMIFNLYDSSGRYFSAIDQFVYFTSNSSYGLRCLYQGNEWVIIYDNF